MMRTFFIVLTVLLKRHPSLKIAVNGLILRKFRFKELAEMSADRIIFFCHPHFKSGFVADAIAFESFGFALNMRTSGTVGFITIVCPVILITAVAQEVKPAFTKFLFAELAAIIVICEHVEDVEHVVNVPVAALHPAIEFVIIHGALDCNLVTVYLGNNAAINKRIVAVDASHRDIAQAANLNVVVNLLHFSHG